MSADRVIASLLRVAKEDLDGALLIASKGNRNAAYLCEQAAEKLIRAILTSEGVHAGIKHELNDMVDKIPDANPLKTALREIEHLAAYATTYRYPAPVGRIKEPPEPEALLTAAKRVADLIGLAAARLGVEISGAGPARTPGPIR